MSDTSFDWNKLRSFKGSVESGFEELCCQLASQENVPAGAKFIRKGTPDAGVECFWLLPNGIEWGWQAKYFRTSPDAAQWQQIDKSVQTALEKHPNLTRYTVCLPLNMPDARLIGKKSALEKWSEHAAKWTSQATKLNHKVEFEFWGESKITAKLSTEENRGRYWFWFDGEQFSLDWFRQKFEENKVLAAGKYIPELDVPLPIEGNFAGLGRTSEFYNEVKSLYSAVRLAHKKIHRYKEVPRLLTGEYDDKISHVLILLDHWVLDSNDGRDESKEITPFPWPEIKQECSNLLKSVWVERDLIREFRTSQKEHPTEHKLSEHADNLIYHLTRLANAIVNLRNFADSEKGEVSNQPVLVVTGSAGQGKTHLLCKVVEHDLAAELPRLLFFGEQFEQGDPWLTMIQILGIDCSANKFLGALNASGQAAGVRLWIGIDALNESRTRNIWSTHLPRMIRQLEPYPWLGLCVSLRNEYEEHIITERIGKDQYTRVVHYGFEGDLSWEAMDKYFSHYEIEPSSPPMLPEFQNPLFLKLFCQAVYSKGLHRIPEGMHGVTSIFQFFVDSLNDSLALRLGYDKRVNLLHKAVERLTEILIENNNDYIQLDKTQEILEDIMASTGRKESFLQALESESFLTVVPMKTEGGMTYEVRFTYQRFADHMIVQRIMKDHFDPENPKTVLPRIVSEKYGIWYRENLVNVFAIQLPETAPGLELPLIMDIDHDKTGVVLDSFIHSLLWRSKDSIHENTFQCIDNHVFKNRDSFYQFMDVVLMLATVENHPLNALWLDRFLSRYPMPRRDSIWTPYIDERNNNESQIHRLITWAWRNDDKTVYSDDTVYLAAITLTWFLSTSVRTIRDKATKALVKLLENRINVLQRILTLFKNIDDVYISERLYAIAYGCALRSSQFELLKPLAEQVYQFVFADHSPPCNVLLRDYARGTIEYVLSRSIALDIDASLIQPPYSSEWPNMEIPEESVLKAWGEVKEDGKDEEWSRHSILNSVMGEFVADFSHYVIGNMERWSSERLNESHTPLGEERFDFFVDSLSPEQREAWDRLQEAIAANRTIPLTLILRKLSIQRRQELSSKEGVEDESETYENLLHEIGLLGVNEYSEKELDELRKKFVETIHNDEKKENEYQNFIISYQENPGVKEDENRFDGKLARRWMVQRVIEIGWTVELFGRYDRFVSMHSFERNENRSERIGKKYQWIAYRELLARLSDNFRLRSLRYLDDGTTEFNGPWSVDVMRDIDASNLLSAGPQFSYHGYKKTWWFTEEYSNWNDPVDHMNWIKKKDDLPNPQNFIEIENEWLSLTGRYTWQQPTIPGTEVYDLPTRDIFMTLNAYIVAKKNISKMIKWLKNGDWHGSLPNGFHSYEIMIGEYYWAPIYKDRTVPYHGYNGWTKGYGKREAPSEVLVAYDEYFRENSEHDYSYEGGYTIHLPCSFLANGMNLIWKGEEGIYRDKVGEVVAMDPSVNKTGPGSLLINKKTLIEFLEREQMTLFWTLYGEKRVLGIPSSVPGRQNILGYYVLQDGIITGEMKHEIEQWKKK